MNKTSGKIKFELIFGIFLLSFLAITVTFIAAFKIVEKQRMEIETFNLQRIYYDLGKMLPGEIRNMYFFMPSGAYYGIYNAVTKELIAGTNLVTSDKIRIGRSETIIGSDFLYPPITLIQPMEIGNTQYTIALRKDFDAEKSLAKKAVYTFTPFAIICLITLTGFSYLFYQNRLLSPFERLKEAYADISETSLGNRLNPVDIKEWDTLFEQFNLMMDRISGYKNGLEQSIEELCKTNTALKSAQEEIIFSEKMATVGRLAAGLAHEIGNPLTSIMGYLSYMIGNAKNNEEKEMLSLILKETERINRIIKDLLNFARAKTDSESFDTCNPRDIVEDTLRLLTPQRDFKKVNLINNFVESMPVSFTAEELKQALLNLIINAMDVTPDGGSIVISSKKERDYLVLSVQDEGGGVPDDIKDKIFEPFFTTKPPGSGTGLGLSVVHTLVNKYGGKVWCENGEKGAVFFVKLKGID